MVESEGGRGRDDGFFFNCHCEPGNPDVGFFFFLVEDTVGSRISSPLFLVPVISYPSLVSIFKVCKLSLYLDIKVFSLVLGLSYLDFFRCGCVNNQFEDF